MRRETSAITLLRIDRATVRPSVPTRLLRAPIHSNTAPASLTTENEGLYRMRERRKRIMRRFVCALFALASGLLPRPASANPYLSKSGEAPASVRAATCAITGGFIHLYAALDANLFDKYGVKVEFVSIRGSGVALAALAADEIQYLYCAADATIPGMASGSD